MGLLDSILGRPTVQAVAPQAGGLLSDPYDTRMSPEEAAKYAQWVKDTSLKMNRDVSLDTEDYDLRGLYKAQGGFGENGHAPDTFKKPNHPTFSDQSQYHSDSMQGGRWDQFEGRDRFTPGPANLKHYSSQQLQEYFRRAEPGVILNMQ